jgi:hypothetical protein
MRRMFEIQNAGNQVIFAGWAMNGFSGLVWDDAASCHHLIQLAKVNH